MAKQRKEPSRYMTAVSSNGGRPRLILNDEGKRIVEVLSSFFVSDEDIASELGVSVDTLKRANNRDAYAEAKKRGMARAKISLRKNQMELSKKNAAMAIFLGKQYLGQSDNPYRIADESGLKQAGNQTAAIADLINLPVPDISVEDAEAASKVDGE